MNIYKYIGVFGVVFFAFANTAFAQSEQQVAQVSIPENHKVPALTGDAAKDVEIRAAQQRDEAQFAAYQIKTAELTAGFSPKGMDYLYSIGFPKMSYTGNARADFERFHTEFRLWETTHQADLPAIQNQLERLNKQ